MTRTVRHLEAQHGRALVSAERLRELLDYDQGTGVFRWLIARGRGVKAGDVAGEVRRDGYVRISIEGRRYQAHRLAWLWVHGRWPDDQLDHVNTKRSDNRLENLREASLPENMQNVRQARVNSKSGLIGASPCLQTGRWEARIYLNRKHHFLGRFDTAEEAHAAYLAAKARMHPFQTITKQEDQLKGAV